jgi:DNA-binding beta-propeller fold protein YncE
LARDLFEDLGMKNLCGHVAAFLSVALLVACGASGGAAFARPIPANLDLQAKPASAAGKYLYAATASSISVYGPGKTAPMRTITAGVAEPSAMAFDHAGNLYVANSAKGANTVTVYAVGGTNLLRAIRMGINRPADLAFDHKENLFVSNNLGRVPHKKRLGSVSVYAPGTNSPLRTITNGVVTPHGLAFDTSGNLYVANCCTKIQVYAPGSGTPLRTLGGLTLPRGMAFGLGGYLFVANAGGNYYCSGFVAKYPPRATKPSLDMPLPSQTGYSCGPFTTLVIDGKANIYVPSTSSDDVDVYAAKNGRRLYTIQYRENGIDNPLAVAIGSEGWLYVANNGSVTVYEPGTTKPARTITSGISGQVYALAFGSR